MVSVKHTTGSFPHTQNFLIWYFCAKILVLKIQKDLSIRNKVSVEIILSTDGTMTTEPKHTMTAMETIYKQI